MVTLANELQPSKAANPIPVTELEMVTLTNELQPLKASFSIAITSPGISTTNKSSTSQLEAWKLEHTTGWMLRKARTSAPGMASDTSFSLFNRCLSPTTTSTVAFGFIFAGKPSVQLPVEFTDGRVGGHYE